MTGKFFNRFAAAAVCMLSLSVFASAARERLPMNGAWAFRYGNTDGANPSASTASWQTVDLPHTWNAEDGADGGANFARGDGWYRKQFTLPVTLSEKHLFLEFEGANQLTTLYIDGAAIPYTHVDSYGFLKNDASHAGGYTKFRYDVTGLLDERNEKTLAVCVNNDYNEKIAPIGADFTFWGGLYRDVTLIAVDDVHFDLLDNGSDGVYMTALKNDGGTWTFTVRATLINETDTAKSASVSVRAHEPDAFETIEGIPEELTPFDESSMYGTETLCEATESVTVPANGKYVYEKSFTVDDPRLWDGLADPYRYQVDISLDGEGFDDSVSDYIGFRTFHVDPDEGFFLNGKAYPLRGVSRHQDRDGMGNAITRKEHEEDFAIIYEIGANAMRLAHYPHNDIFVDLCERYGIVLWAEIPFITSIGGEGEYGAFNAVRKAYVNNCREQLIEMIREQYNRPAIMFWGLQNEVDTPYDTVMTAIMENDLQPLAKAEDPNRLTTFATFHELGYKWASDLKALNFYPAWYGYETYHFKSEIDAYHKRYPKMCLAVSEYGAGGSVLQHTEGIERPEPFGDPVHPEEYQTYVHEQIVRQLYEKDTDGRYHMRYLWATYIWNMFDFGADTRNEGSRNGINDKGLVTYDRKVKKDAFYVYKAVWSGDPFVHLQRSRFEVRDTDHVLVKASSNCDTLTLKVNGTVFGKAIKNDGFGQFAWENVPLAIGKNTVSVTGEKDGKTYTESVEWTREKSADTRLRSNAYSVDNLKKTVVLRSSLDASAVSGSIFSDRNATLAVYDADGKTAVTSGEIKPHMILRVTAEDGVTISDYLFLENNIAFGKTVTTAAGTTTLLTDGNTATVFSVANTYPQNLELDLGAVSHVASIVINTSAGYSYKVYAAEEPNRYRLAGTFTGAASGSTVLMLGDVTARYLRITVSGGTDTLSVSEIEVYGWSFNTSLTVNEDERVIFVDASAGVVPTTEVLRMLGIAGNCTYSYESKNAVYYASDGDSVMIVDNCDRHTEYTVSTSGAYHANLSQNKPVTSSKSTQSGFGVEKINNGVDTDGSNGTADDRYQANGGYPCEVIVDLQGYFDVDSFYLHTFWAPQRAYQYDISYSLDGSEYTVAVDYTKNTDPSGRFTHNLNTPVTARYIRLRFTACYTSAGGTAGAHEFKVYGKRSTSAAVTLTPKYPVMLLAPGTAEKIVLDAGNDELPEDIYFVSDDESVAKVASNGTVTAVSEGSAVITAYSPSARCETGVSVTVGKHRVLSLSRPVIACSDHGQPGNYTDEFNDGVLGDINDPGATNRWQSAAGGAQYLLLDLERSCFIDRFETYFFFGAARTCGYRIYVSDNRADFANINDIASFNAVSPAVDKWTNTENGIHIDDLTAPVRGRFVLFAVTKPTAGNTAGVLEFTVCGDEAEGEISDAAFTKEDIFLAVGDTYKAEITVSPASADKSRVRFESASDAIASVDENGVITANGVGTVGISVILPDGTATDTLTVRVDKDRLLSRGKPVVDFDDKGVGYEGGTGFVNTVDKITDGARPTNNYNFPRWQVTNQNTHYAVVDLEDVYDISKIDMYFFYYYARSNGYRLSVSDDCEVFTVVCDRLDNTILGVQTFEPDKPVRGRYVKIEMTAPTSGATSTSTAGLYEIEIFGRPAEDEPMPECTYENGAVKVVNVSAAEDAEIVAAVYTKEGRLCGIRVVSDADGVPEIEMAAPESADHVKLFFFGSVQGMQPVAEAITLTVQHGD